MVIVRILGRASRTRLGVFALIAAVVGSAVGIATAAASLVDRLVIAPIAVPAGRLGRMVTVVEEASSGVRDTFTMKQFDHVRSATEAYFDEVAAVGSEALPVTIDNATESATVAFVSDAFFEVLEVRPFLGRLFLPSEHALDARPVVVLDHGYWERAFRGDVSALGREIQVGRDTAVVVGVAPDEFAGTDFGNRPAFYAPLPSIEQFATLPGNYLQRTEVAGAPRSWLRLWALLRQGLTPETAARSLEGVTATPPLDPAATTGPLNVLAATDAFIPIGPRPVAREFLFLLVVLAATVTAGAAATTTGWTMLDSDHHARHVAIRWALGAPAAQLAAIGAWAAILPYMAGLAISPLAYAGFNLLLGSVEVGPLSMGDWIRPIPTGRTLAIGLGCWLLLTGLALGRVVPRILGGDQLVVLREGTATARSRSGWLVVQVAVAVSLLCLGTAFVRGAPGSLAATLSYNPQQVLSVDIDFGHDATSMQIMTTRVADLKQSLRSEPSVLSTAVTAHAGGMTREGNLIVDGAPVSAGGSVAYRAVEPEYFDILGSTAVRGRVLSAGDVMGAPVIAVVSQSLASAVGGADRAVGRVIAASIFGKVRVVGVASDITLDPRDPRPMVLYLSYPQHTHLLGAGRTLVVKAATPGAATSAIRAAMRRVGFPEDGRAVDSMTARMERQLSTQRFGERIVIGLAMVASLIALAAAYGLAASILFLKRREFHVRTALGADSSDLMNLLLRQMTPSVLLGLVAGVLGYWWVGSGIDALLLDGSIVDVMNVVPGGIAVGFIVLIVWLPLARATARGEYLRAPSESQ